MLWVGGNSVHADHTSWLSDLFFSYLSFSLCLPSSVMNISIMWAVTVLWLALVSLFVTVGASHSSSLCHTPLLFTVTWTGNKYWQMVHKTATQTGRLSFFFFFFFRGWGCKCLYSVFLSLDKGKQNMSVPTLSPVKYIYCASNLPTRFHMVTAAWINLRDNVFCWRRKWDSPLKRGSQGGQSWWFGHKKLFHNILLL